MKYEDDGFVDVGLPASAGIGLRECLPAEVHRIQRLGELSHAEERYELLLSAHSCTHFDLPWAVHKQDLRGQRVPDLGTPRAASMLRRRLRPLVVEALALDFRDKLDVFHGLLDEDTGLVRWAEWTLDPVLKLLQRLEISMEDIMRAVEGDRDALKGKVLLIRTGWIPTLVPSTRDCNHPFFEGTSPFLLHPFLSTTTVNELFSSAGLGVAGICTDTSNVEFPLVFASPKGTLEMFLRVLRRVRRRHPDYCKFDKLGHPTQHVHSVVLSGNLLLGELFDFSGITGFEELRARYLSGKLLVIPFPCETMYDAVLCRVFFSVQQG